MYMTADSLFQNQIKLDLTLICDFRNKNGIRSGNQYQYSNLIEDSFLAHHHK